jgi:hypothetical protein
MCNLINIFVGQVRQAAWGMVVLLVGGSAAYATMIPAASLDYGISGKQNNNFQFDFTGQPIWTAGAQRSDNGSADAANRRAGRVFVDFQLTSAIIAEAALAGATATLQLPVDSIGMGVFGTPYTDGLDLRFLGLSATDRNAVTLWNTGGIGLDQADIVATTDTPGVFNVLLTNPSVLSTISGATANDFISFGLSNSIGVDNTAPVGNSTAETYGFQLNTSTSNWGLDVSAIPEPSAVGLIIFGLLSGSVFRGRL